MKFKLGTQTSLSIDDSEVFRLLSSVYVTEGYTSKEGSEDLFHPSKIKERGEIICARTYPDNIFAGMVILVPPESPACKFAGEKEAEIHLLAVQPEFRKKGLGKLLMQQAIRIAIQKNYKKLLLWTQTSMESAQRLYRTLGFIPNLNRNFETENRVFHFYEKKL